jgi:hypothetical protein
MANTIFDRFHEALAQQVATMLTNDQAMRLAALHAARSAMPEAGVSERIALSQYILTGTEYEPAEPDDPEVVIRLEKRTQTEDYPFRSGDVLVLGPQIYSNTVDGPAENTVINWQGENFVPQRLSPLTGVVGPDPDFAAASAEKEPAPSSGAGWRGRRGGAPT